MSPDHLTQTPGKESPIQLEEFLMQANTNRIRCVDERKATALNNGVAIPGATDGVLDAIKSLLPVDEFAARQLLLRAKLPIGGHIDEHHGSKGCGYRKLVETEHGTVDAREAVLAESRLTWITDNGGEVLTLLGDHHPTDAVINYRTGTTIDTEGAGAKGKGIFDFDIWAMKGYAQKLDIDPDDFTDHMLDVYKKTVTRLTSITQFIELH
jgi:hypothetical protein